MHFLILHLKKNVNFSIYFVAIFFYTISFINFFFLCEQTQLKKL